RHAKLPVEDQLVMSLKYWRQYGTQKERAFEFEAGEATVHDTIVWVEHTLVKSGAFSLPGRKALLEDNGIEVVLADVTESPVERPKKNSGNGIRAKRNAIP
ncbi:MAG: transposase family protein, partial [Treponema sp.]|nr:transposase family protein [Treponema sp.]